MCATSRAIASRFWSSSCTLTSDLFLGAQKKIVLLCRLREKHKQQTSPTTDEPAAPACGSDGASLLPRLACFLSSCSMGIVSSDPTISFGAIVSRWEKRGFYILFKCFLRTTKSLRCRIHDLAFSDIDRVHAEGALRAGLRRWHKIVSLTS